MSQTLRQPPVALRKIIHVDMDAFYASVEQRENPDLAKRPVVVGGEADARGVVAAASYEARSFGIHSAMPMKTALRLCPHAVRIPANFTLYRRVSGQLHAIFREYTDLIEPVALDEAYLDVTYNKLDIPFGSRVAKMLKGDIRRELGLTASAGVAPCKFLAKIASDFEKPDGLVVILPDQVQEFLCELSVSKIPGVGQVTRKKLQHLGINTIGQLAAQNKGELVLQFGKRGSQLWHLANGMDDEPVTTAREPKQISQETTFPTDIYDIEEMHTALRDLAAELSGRLRRRKLKGRVLTLKVRYPNFKTITRSLSLPLQIDLQNPILQHARDLLRRTDAQDRGVRLLGIGLAGFEEEKTEQLDLFARLESA